MFATADHNIETVQKLQSFCKISLLQNCFLTSFLNQFSTFFQQIKGYFNAIPLMHDMYN